MLKVLDLSHRLPGPLAGHIFESLGAEVTKVEDVSFGDPFKDGFFKEMDPSFADWYENLNTNKRIVVMDFNGDTATDEIANLVKENDIIINGLPPKFIEKFHISPNDLTKKYQSKVFIQMIGSKNSKEGIHDLNVLARFDLLRLFLSDKEKGQIQSPPFLPMGGISYGAYLCSFALSRLLTAKEEKSVICEIVSLEESVAVLLRPFFSKKLAATGQRKFLHNGRYPCYALYPLKDEGFLAVASLEPKYWKTFCNCLDLRLSLEDRFEFENPSVFQTIKEKTRSLTIKEAESLFENQDCCVDIVTP